MLHYTVVFFVLAIIVVIIGFGGFAIGFTQIAKILSYAFLVIIIMGYLIDRNP